MDFRKRAFIEGFELHSNYLKLKHFADAYMEKEAASFMLPGAALGAGGGALYSLLAEEEGKRNWLRNMLIGAGAGGLEGSLIGSTEGATNKTPSQYVGQGKGPSAESRVQYKKMNDGVLSFPTSPSDAGKSVGKQLKKDFRSMSLAGRSARAAKEGPKGIQQAFESAPKVGSKVKNVRAKQLANVVAEKGRGWAQEEAAAKRKRDIEELLVRNRDLYSKAEKLSRPPVDMGALEEEVGKQRLIKRIGRAKQSPKARVLAKLDKLKRMMEKAQRNVELAKTLPKNEKNKQFLSLLEGQLESLQNQYTAYNTEQGRRLVGGTPVPNVAEEPIRDMDVLEYVRSKDK